MKIVKIGRTAIFDCENFKSLYHNSMTILNDLLKAIKTDDRLLQSSLGT